MGSFRRVLERHRPLVMGHNGMVAAAHPLASLAGVDVLRRGGNAVDAAICVNAVLNVTQPGACGIGGDLFALIYKADEGRVRFLNGSGRTPMATDVSTLQELGAVPERGIRSVSVPGCVDAWFTMHERVRHDSRGRSACACHRFGRERLSDQRQDGRSYFGHPRASPAPSELDRRVCAGR